MRSTLVGLEADIAQYVGTRFAIACSSARAAIRFSLLALGMRHGDEVVIPDFACQILPIVVFCTDGVPVFCDIDRQNCTLSPAALSKVLSSKTKAIIFIHLFGLPVDLSPILEIARQRGIVLIDDGAQALGSSINGKKVGSFGDVGILTFNKFLDVDVGGAITTNNSELASKIRSIRDGYEHRWLSTRLGYRIMEATHFKSRKAMKSIFVGTNYLYKLLNITLAKRYFEETVGWVQIDPSLMKSRTPKPLENPVIDQLMTYAGRYWHSREMEEIEVLHLKKELAKTELYLQDRRRIAKLYDECLDDGNFKRIAIQQNSCPSYLRYPIMLDNSRALAKCLQDLQQTGFSIDYRYKPLHLSPSFSWITKGSSFSESDYVFEHILPLPVTPGMNSDQVMKVIAAVNPNLR